jgi:hypothetical protein
MEKEVGPMVQVSYDQHHSVFQIAISGEKHLERNFPGRFKLFFVPGHYQDIVSGPVRVCWKCKRRDLSQKTF